MAGGLTCRSWQRNISILWWLFYLDIFIINFIAQVHGLIVVRPNHWRTDHWFGHTTSNPWTSAITLLLYTSSHILEMFWIILGVVLGLIIKTQEDRILAVVHWWKRSDYLRNHAYSYSDGSMAFVLLAYYWITMINMSASSSTAQFKI